jgi:hypothetical protein
MIAVVILLIGVIGTVGQLPAGLRLLIESGDSLQQLTIMESELERVESTPFADLQLGTVSRDVGAFHVTRTIGPGPTARSLLVIVRVQAPGQRRPRQMATVVAASW